MNISDSSSEESPKDSNIESQEQKSEPQTTNLGRFSLEASSSFFSPIPPPGILDKYDQILPGATDRILRMAEKEQAHRHEMQGKLVESQVSDFRQERSEKRLGQIFGFSIGVVSIIAGSVTAILGEPLAGGIIGSTGVVGLVSVFVAGRIGQQDSQNFQLLDDEEIEGE
jgi:uncharacterized membrane protein